MVSFLWSGVGSRKFSFLFTVDLGGLGGLSSFIRVSGAAWLPIFPEEKSSDAGGRISPLMWPLALLWSERLGLQWGEAGPLFLAQWVHVHVCVCARTRACEQGELFSKL